MGKTVGYNLSLAGVQGEYFLAREEGYADSWLPLLANEFSSDQPSETYPWLGQNPKMAPWTGPRSATEPRDDVVQIWNKDYEVGLVFKLRDWQRDKTGQMRMVGAQLADETIEKPMGLISELILANGTCYDGGAMFATHTVGGQTIDNDLATGDGLAGAAAPTVAQQSSNILIATQKMLSWKGDQGQPLNRRAKQFLVMVPTNMLGATIGALKDQLPGGASNTMVGFQEAGFSYRVVANPDLDGVTNTFYLVRLDGRVKPFIYQEEIVNMNMLGEGSEWTHMNNKVRFDADMSCGAGYGRFEFIARCVCS